MSRPLAEGPFWVGTDSRDGAGSVVVFRTWHLGYRTCFQKRGNTVLILLCGGDKGTQTKDITTARRLVAEWSG
jgi:putative addiction module killer protein